jgi:hypothetical protein
VILNVVYHKKNNADLQTRPEGNVGKRQNVLVSKNNTHNARSKNFNPRMRVRNPKRRQVTETVMGK